MIGVAVASAEHDAYSQRMFSRLLRFLTLIALLLAPLSMSHAAMAMPAGAPAAADHHTDAVASAHHCGGTDQPDKERPVSGIDCTIACSAVSSAESDIVARPILAAPVPQIALASSLHGLHPESDPPPPRFA